MFGTHVSKYKAPRYKKVAERRQTEMKTELLERRGRLGENHKF